MLGFFFRHYDPWVDRYIVFDDGSTDSSPEILRRHPKVELRPFPRVSPESFPLSQLHFINEAWKESRGAADWVIVVDIDEHLQARAGQNRSYLRDCASQGVTWIPAVGYQMLSEDFPREDELLARTLTIGAPSVFQSKLSLFDPNAIVETHFTMGRHEAKPVGELRLPARDELMLLHYKYLGFERCFDRLQTLGARRSALDIQNGWSNHRAWDRAELEDVLKSMRARSVDVYRGSESTAAATGRWWRPEGRAKPSWLDWTRRKLSGG